MRGSFTCPWIHTEVHNPTTWSASTRYKSDMQLVSTMKHTITRRAKFTNFTQQSTVELSMLGAMHDQSSSSHYNLKAPSLPHLWCYVPDLQLFYSSWVVTQLHTLNPKPQYCTLFHLSSVLYSQPLAHVACIVAHQL